MNEIIIAIAFILILAISVTIVMVIVLKNADEESDASKRIVNYFKPDNTSYELTEMIEFYKNTNETITFKIK